MSHPRNKSSASTDVDAAIEALPTEDLRQVIHELLMEFDGRTYARVVGSIVARAARGASGWTPAVVSDDDVTDVLAFVESAKRVGRADPAQVDAHLRRGQAAFLRRDYAKALQILGTVLTPIGDGDIDLGQHEMIDEVLGTDTYECANQYVVSAYMTAAPAERPDAVWAAIEAMRRIDRFFEPVRDMERASPHPLPGLDEFLPSWRALIERMGTAQRKGDWDTDQDLWMREVVRRLDGAAGLAQIARATKRADDLRAWCKYLVDERDWKAALLAFDEAAEIVADRDYKRSDFLDGAALAAQNLDRNDLPARLERAWRVGPTMQRLQRWLDSSISSAIFRKRVVEALDVCPKEAARQRALLHVLDRDFVAAAKLLATSSGLGWSGSEHPGHLLFPLFSRLLGGKEALARQSTGEAIQVEASLDDIDPSLPLADEPSLFTPKVATLIERAGVAEIRDAATRAVLLAAMQTAAESRLAGVTAHKRRRHYGHAVALVATCVALDGTDQAVRWAEALKMEYRRFPALREEFDHAMRTS